MTIVFWGSLAVLVYVYVGYPLFLRVLGAVRPRPFRESEGSLPSVSIILPAHNEIAVIESKLENTLALEYPRDRLQILVVSDASKDGTDDVLKRYADEGRIEHLRVPERRGKGAALNLGLDHAQNEVVVFSDASILLESEALRNLVRPLSDPEVGCVSGEDHIPGGGGEGAYGRYELFLRNLESRVASIVGASGCFYGKRRELCVPFREGMAPDFLSVLETVARGFRAVTQPSARGEMRAVRESGREFARKVRTMLRGMTALMHYRRLLNPFRFGLFALELWSHKILRWSAGIFLVLLAVSNVALAAGPLFRAFLALQGVCYGLGLVGWLAPARVARLLPFRIPFFFCLVNLAGLAAWVRCLSGRRQEIWEPSRRG